MQLEIKISLLILSVIFAGCTSPDEDGGEKKPDGAPFSMGSCDVIASVSWLPGEKEETIQGWPIGAGISEPVVEFGLCKVIRTETMVHYDVEFGWLKGNEQTPPERCISSETENLKILKWMIVENETLATELSHLGFPISLGAIDISTTRTGSPSARIEWSFAGEESFLENLLAAEPPTKIDASRALAWPKNDGVIIMEQELSFDSVIQSENLMLGEIHGPQTPPRDAQQWVGTTEFQWDYNQESKFRHYLDRNCTELDESQQLA